MTKRREVIKTRIGTTGATGGLGKRLSEILQERGYEIRYLIRKGSDIGSLNLNSNNTVYGDLSDEDALEEFVKGIDVCVHIAAQVTATSKDVLFETNINGTRKLCQAIEKNNIECRLIYCSSIVVRELKFYQKPFVSDYTMSKYYAEKVVDEYSKKIKATVIYPGYIMGKYDRALLPYIINMLQGGLKFWVKGGEKNAPIIYVDDLCELFYQVIINESTVGKKYVSLEKQEKGMQHVLKIVALRLGYSIPQKTYSKSAIRIYLKVNSILSTLFGRKKNDIRLRTLNILSNHASYFNNAYKEIGWKQKYSFDEIVNMALDDYIQRQETK